MTQVLPCPPAPASQPAPPPALDLAAILARQQATWAAGDYAVIGATLQIVAESLCEAVDLHGGERVLDVACGSGNATVAAARRHADATGLDYVPALLEVAAARARAEGLPLSLHEGDCQALPFPDDSFDVVLSTFGTMFAPDHARTARELGRVCRPGGRIGLASWTPEGFVGALFRTVGRLVPPPAGLAPPALWGTDDHLRTLFAGAAAITSARREFVFRYRSPAHFVDTFRTYFGPVHKAFESLPEVGKRILESDLLSLLGEWNGARDGSLRIRGEYLETVIVTA